MSLTVSITQREYSVTVGALVPGRFFVLPTQAREEGEEASVYVVQQTRKLDEAYGNSVNALEISTGKTWGFDRNQVVWELTNVKLTGEVNRG